jgi:hypothetical protein
MSDERRKRQQERDGTGGTSAGSRKMLTWAAIGVVVVGGYLALYYRNNHHYDAFAKCLSSKQAKMYGLYWCPHCIDQKEKFGKSFQYVPYVECAIKDSREMAPECTQAGVKLFPSWQFGSNPPKEGILSLEELGDKTGCSLP